MAEMGPGLPHGGSLWAEGPRDDNQGDPEMIDLTSESAALMRN